MTSVFSFLGGDGATRLTTSSRYASIKQSRYAVPRA
jgi:hypothetical protein